MIKRAIIALKFMLFILIMPLLGAFGGLLLLPAFLIWFISGYNIMDWYEDFLYNVLDKLT